MDGYHLAPSCNPIHLGLSLKLRSSLSTKLAWYVFLYLGFNDWIQYFGIQLARRFFHSFVKNDSDFLYVENIEPFFPTKEEAARVFALFDQDSNGDISREEMEMACL